MSKRIPEKQFKNNQSTRHFSTDMTHFSRRPPFDVSPNGKFALLRPTSGCQRSRSTLTIMHRKTLDVNRPWHFLRINNFECNSVSGMRVMCFAFVMAVVRIEVFNFRVVLFRLIFIKKNNDIDWFDIGIFKCYRFVWMKYIFASRIWMIVFVHCR